MRGTRIGRICLIASLVAGAIGAANASAAEYEVRGLPELGRCVRVAEGTGVYPTGSCITAGSPGTGSFEWTQLTAEEKRTFTGSALESILTTVGHTTIHCSSASLSGEYTGPKNATVHLELHGCTNSLAAQCQSEPTSKGEIKSLPLEGELGFIKNVVKEGKTIVATGFDLKAQSPFSDLIIFECGGVAESVRVDGSVIGRIKPFDRMTTVSNLVYTRTKSGKQAIEKFQGGVKDTLTTTFMSGLESSSGASTLTIKSETGHYSTLLEIKAKGN
ncbi:MAG: hypothetical protein JWN81_306 [Solirubrobacterales bacterium]|nr:hypothetical protein [Solirubrobacterales bacterium]